MQFTRNLRVIFNFTLRVITRNVTVTYRNVTGLYNPTSNALGASGTSNIAVSAKRSVAFYIRNPQKRHDLYDQTDFRTFE